MERFQIVGAPTCRAVYVKGLFEMTLGKGLPDIPKNYKYNAQLYVPKSDEAKVKQVMEKYMEAFEALQKTAKFSGKSPKAINEKNNCLIDGDELADAKDGYEHCRGYLIIKMSSPRFRPLVYDNASPKKTITNGIPLQGLTVDNMSDETLESGDYVFANISFWEYSNDVAQGIGCNPHAFVRAGAGERIGGASTDVGDYIDTSEYEAWTPIFIGDVEMHPPEGGGIEPYTWSSRTNDFRRSYMEDDIYRPSVTDTCNDLPF